MQSFPLLGADPSQLVTAFFAELVRPLLPGALSALLTRLTQVLIPLARSD
jgi:hypothetical protein